LVALRGDLPCGRGERGELRYANELVAFIRERTGDHFHVEVACYPEFHPQAKSPRADLSNFKRKLDAGADSAITQYFSTPTPISASSTTRGARHSRADRSGNHADRNFSQLARFSDNCGAEIPRWLR